MKWNKKYVELFRHTWYNYAMCIIIYIGHLLMVLRKILCVCIRCYVALLVVKPADVSHGAVFG